MELDLFDVTALEPPLFAIGEDDFMPLAQGIA
jgi:hypothetical protein